MPVLGERSREVTPHRLDLTPKPSRWGFVRGCGCLECLAEERRYSREYKRRWRARQRFERNFEKTKGVEPVRPDALSLRGE